MSVNTQAIEARDRAKEHLEEAYAEIIEALRQNSDDFGHMYVAKLLDAAKNINVINESI